MFQLIGDGEEQLPLVAFQLAEERNYDEFDVASQLAAERGWMVPAYTLPPNADHVKMMRALVKLTLGHTLATTLGRDIAEACETLIRRAARRARPQGVNRGRVLSTEKPSGVISVPLIVSGVRDGTKPHTLHDVERGVRGERPADRARPNSRAGPSPSTRSRSHR